MEGAAGQDNDNGLFDGNEPTASHSSGQLAAVLRAGGWISDVVSRCCLRLVGCVGGDDDNILWDTDVDVARAPSKVRGRAIPPSTLPQLTLWQLQDAHRRTHAVHCHPS